MQPVLAAPSVQDPHDSSARHAELAEQAVLDEHCLILL